jgi:hypothetical protein
MKLTSRFLLLVLLAAIPALGCDETSGERRDAKPAAREKPPEAKKVLVGKNVFLEIQGTKRRVLISGQVCRREGQLEHLLCRTNTKEHEAVLAADVDARKIHEALILAGAVEGSPVQFQPKFQPPTGQKIRVTLLYEDKGKLVSVPGQSWIKNMQSGKQLDSDWVFAGSRIVENPLDANKKIYLANDGDLICVCNFEGALLDLSIPSSKEDADRVFAAFTERIPPVETKVVIALEPFGDAPKKPKK